MIAQEITPQLETDCRATRDDLLDAFDLCLAPLKVTVARLSNEDIRRMKRQALIEVIKFSGAFSSRGWVKQLPFMDYEDLDRLAFLARRCCRHEVNTAYEERGRRVPFLNDL